MGIAPRLLFSHCVREDSLSQGPQLLLDSSGSREYYLCRFSLEWISSHWCLPTFGQRAGKVGALIANRHLSTPPYRCCKFLCSCQPNINKRPLWTYRWPHGASLSVFHLEILSKNPLCAFWSVLQMVPWDWLNSWACFSSGKAGIIRILAEQFILPGHPPVEPSS